MTKYMVAGTNRRSKIQLFDTKAEAELYAEKKSKKLVYRVHVSKVSIGEDGSLTYI